MQSRDITKTAFNHHLNSKHVRSILIPEYIFRSILIKSNSMHNSNHTQRNSAETQSVYTVLKIHCLIIQEYLE